MDFINFTNDKRLGIQTIDNQHFELASLINQLYNNFENVDHESIKKAFSLLLHHIKLHFEHEEKLMIEHKFDGFYSHKMEHQQFYQNIKNVEHEFMKDQRIFDSTVLESLKRWFFNHIELKDRKLAEHIKCREDLYEKGTD
jgi:hemerythrin